MPVTVQIPTPLRKFTGGTQTVELPASALPELLDELSSRFPEISKHLRDDRGEVRRFVNIYVNDEDIRFLGGAAYRFRDGDTVLLVPSIAGGAAKTLRVMKFGGSSLIDSAAIRHVTNVIRDEIEEGLPLIVCSACGGVTNSLIEIADLVRDGKIDRALWTFDAVTERHRVVANELGGADGSLVVFGEIEELAIGVREHIFGRHNTEHDAAWRDEVVSHGERMSVRLVAAALREIGVAADAIDASSVIVTDEAFGSATPLRRETLQRAAETIAPLLSAGIVPVVTGFIGATRAGKTTTLGRNSSDFSATVLADAIDADEVSIWTDVDGVFDCDPRLTAGQATLLDELSYEEAMELAQRGAKVLHPRTIEPLIEKKIALRIRNTFNHQHPGTWIGPGVRSFAG
jgi:bifunctional aspartokinase / homoserine dehydrogenase 1